MKEPVRLRDPRSGVDARIRALLLDDETPAPKAAEVEGMWSSLAVHIAPLPIPPPIPAPPAVGVAATAATGTVLGKITLVAVTTAVGAGVGWQGLRSRHPTAAHHHATPGILAARTSPAQPGAPDLHTIAAAPAPALATGEPPSVLPLAAPPMPTAARPSPPKRMRLETTGRPPGPTADPARPPPLPDPALAPALAAVREPTVATSLPPPPASMPSLAAGEARGRPFEPGPALPGAVAREVAAPLPLAASPGATHSRALETARTVGRPSTYALHGLAEESRCLANARAALRSHDPGRALDLLQTVPSTPALAQEREALTIEAMAQKPELRASAAERARIFLQAYPQSPYRAIISSLAGKRD